MKVEVLIEGVHGDKDAEGRLIHEVKPICSSVTLIRGEKNILVDTGYRGYETKLIQELSKRGLKAEDIDYVINTHFHIDHCFNNYLFKDKTIVNGQVVWTPEGVEIYEKPEDIQIPGVKIMSTPGHFHSHISVVVPGKQTIVVSGDVINAHHILNREEFADYFNDDLDQSIKKILDVADVIIPGHGPVIKELESLKQAIGDLDVKDNRN